MPIVSVQVIENVLTPEQKKEIIQKITETIVSIEVEALREVTWVKIEEIKEGDWGGGGHPLTVEDVNRIQIVDS